MSKKLKPVKCEDCGGTIDIIFFVTKGMIIKGDYKGEYPKENLYGDYWDVDEVYLKCPGCDEECSPPSEKEDCEMLVAYALEAYGMACSKLEKFLGFDDKGNFTR